MSLQGFEILVIDDDKDFIKLTRLILESTGARTYSAESIALGIAALQKKLPHLILLDLNLPDASGLDFMEIRKKLETLKSIPIMIMSSKNDRQTVLKSLKLGAIDFLTKPITRFTLVNKVERILKSYKNQPLSHTFEKPIETQITIPSTLIKMGEKDVMVECAAKLTGDTRIELKARVFETLGIEKAICKINSNPSHLIMDNLFTSTISFFGLSSATLKKIQETLSQWK
ncbi:MAG: response regulator [Xanthomonadaceae bacterium]|nr:response regulator [Xanthomonadaceae bacterium]